MRFSGFHEKSTHPPSLLVQVASGVSAGCSINSTVFDWISDNEIRISDTVLESSVGGKEGVWIVEYYIILYLYYMIVVVVIAMDFVCVGWLAGWWWCECGFLFGSKDNSRSRPSFAFRLQPHNHDHNHMDLYSTTLFPLFLLSILSSTFALLV